MTIVAFDQEIYDRYGLLNLPRKFGYPVQFPIRSAKHLERLIMENDGKFPIFMSANAHNDEYVLIGQIYSDFDGHGFYTEEEALKDVRKVGEYMEGMKLDFLADKTGRGFRILLKVDPDIRKIRETDGIIKGYSRHLKESLNLKTMDLKVAESKRILRPPLTTYIYLDRETKEHVVTKRHILPMDKETLFNSDLQELVYMSEVMEFHVMPVTARRSTITELAEYEQETEYMPSGEPAKETIDFMEFSPDYFREQVEDIIRNTDETGHDLGPDTELIKKLYTVHPDHQSLLIACIKAKESNYHLNLNSTLSFFAKLSLDAKWNHRNLDIQREQITGIYKAGYKVKKQGEEMNSKRRILKKQENETAIRKQEVKQ